MNVTHCYCFDCKAVFTRHLHQKTKPTHRVGTFSHFPPPNNRIPHPDDVKRGRNASSRLAVVADAAQNVHGEGDNNDKEAEDQNQQPAGVRSFTIWCLIRDTDDSGQPLDSYDEEETPFCNINLPIELASVERNPWPSTRSQWNKLRGRFQQFMDRNNGNDQYQNIHQSLLTSLIAASDDKDESHSAIRTWEQVSRCLSDRTLHTQLGLDPSSDHLVLVLMDTSFPSRFSIQRQYDDIEDYLQGVGAAYNGKTVVYPNREERTASEHKLPDIRALDDIAEVQGTWRPTTCFGYGPCALKSKQDILKRTWSCASCHVTKRDSQARLTCDQVQLRSRRLKKNRMEEVAAGDDESHWFHQEYVKLLSEVELRVFIATRPDPNGFRGLSGEVIRVCCTQRTGNEIIATEAADNTYEGLGTSKEAVHEFSLGVFEALRDHNFGWARRFETLEVGCRLDISVKELGGPLFVNEITRWNGANYFADYCTGAPHALLCSTFVKSWARWYEQLVGQA
ncbi:hypothetical protein CSOJ01_05793 [Colletotrichum sojae]|uniref:Uncharacterized protein n=1 Tax=Colletotrichum sojae TaxID=2175907 RepID=A0A8H6JDY3_9PEZI|nr:hypothetical protein CSOJ01_05793 [Colletotrichum sojae]